MKKDYYNASVENFSIVEKFSTDARFNEAGDMLIVYQTSFVNDKIKETKNERKKDTTF